MRRAVARARNGAALLKFFAMESAGKGRGPFLATARMLGRSGMGSPAPSLHSVDERMSYSEADGPSRLDDVESLASYNSESIWKQRCVFVFSVAQCRGLPDLGEHERLPKKAPSNVFRATYVAPFSE